MREFITSIRRSLVVYTFFIADDDIEEMIYDDEFRALI